MIRLVFQELRARPWRAVLTGLGAVVGVGLIAATLVLSDSAIGRQDETVSDVMLVAGAVALLVGAFIISSTFSVTVTQRSRELALLRCLGATGGQLRHMVRVESMILGIAASLVGLGSGVAVAADFALSAALACSLSRPWTRHPPPSGIRPIFFTSRWAMCPGQRAVIVPGLRLFSPVGSRKRRCPSPSLDRCLETVRRLIWKPSSASSEVIRCDDHFASRRHISIWSITHAGVVFGLVWGAEERSRSPRSP